MNDWFELSVWELAALADVEPGRRTLLDEVSTVGDWLRLPEIKEAGQSLLEQRVGNTADPEFWSLVLGAARIVGAAEAGSSVVFRSHGDPVLCIVTARGAEGAVQLAVRGPAVGIRPTAWPPAVDGLATEILTSVEADEILALKVGPGDADRHAVRWADGVLTTEAGAAEARAWDRAVHAVCGFLAA